MDSRRHSTQRIVRERISRGRRTKSRRALSVILASSIAALGFAAPVSAANTVLCGTPAKDGVNGSYAGGVPNSYWAGAGGSVTGAGSTTITLGTLNATGSSTLLTAGDLILIYQTQGATINTSNSSAYGSGGSNGSGLLSAYTNAGVYEYARVVSVSGNTVTIAGAGTGGGLVHNYFNLSYYSQGGGETGILDWQVIRVPQYGNYSVGSNLYTAQWNGSSGGVVALDVSGTLTLTNQINADGYGFRGGGQNAWGNGFGGAAATSTTTAAADGASDVDYDYAPTSSSISYSSYQGGPDGFKGEGIAGTPSWVYASGASSPVFAPSTISSFAGDGMTSGYPGGSKARGAPANAGGGATDGDASGWSPYSNSATGPNQYNSGGGGGANGGAGGLGGQNWSGTQNTYSMGYVTSQGIGGAAVTPNIASSLILGGGGGAGSNNDGSNGQNVVALGGGRTFTATSATASSGASGGGLVMLRVGTLGGGTISAQGISAPDPDNDGGGGGGGGGTVVITGTGTVTATVNVSGGTGASSTGGNGAYTAYGAPYPHGTGGGGGGGVVMNSGTSVTATLTGGPAGDTAAATGTSSTATYYGTAGSNGVQTTGITPSQIIGTRSGAECSLLLLAKRYTTKISGGATTTYTTYVNDGYTDPNSLTVVDTDPVWPQNGGNPAIPGALTLTNLPGDTLEYTIYMLSAGGKALSNGAVCDFVPPDQTLVTTAYNGGASSLRISSGYSAPTVSYFSTASGSGNTGIYPINTSTGAGSTYALPSICGTAPKSVVTGKYSPAAVYYAPGAVPSYLTSNAGYAAMSFEAKTS